MKTKVSFIAIFLVLLSACEKDDAIENPGNTLEAKAGNSNDAQLFANELVTLNGSLSKDKGGKPFQYLWSFKNKPANSASELEDEATVTPKFMPDKAGIYLVQLKIYNQSFFDTDEISLSVKEKDGSPPVQETVVIDADIEEDTHLINIFEDDTKIDYLVTEDVSVKALLTIDPSVTIGFEAGKGMFVDIPGAIVAVGSPEGQILFTGKNKTPGYWKGLIISSNNTSNVLERTTVEYGGGYNARGINVPANIALDNASFSYLTMRNSITRHSAGYGLVIEPGTFWNAPLGNKIAHNQKPLMIAASQLGSINGLQEFDENITNVIEVIGNRVNAPETSFWINPQDASGQNYNHLPYLIMGKIEIASEVIVGQGIEFVFDKDAEITITPTGSLSAIGTESNPIQFRAKISDANGFWKGISFASNSPKNQLKYVEISEAGSSPMDGFSAKTAIGVDGEQNASIEITDAKIAKSGGHGMLIEKNASLGGFGFMKFTDNKSSALSVPSNLVAHLAASPALEFSNNGHDGIEIFESALMQDISVETVWPPLHFGATYLVSGNLAIQSGLKVLPGAIFEIAEDKMIGIFPNGYLYAKGTSNQKIVFTGAQKTNGFWNGIRFLSKSAKNVMDFTEVSYAGKTAMPGISKITAIGLDGDYLGNLTITNSKIAHGLGYGIVLDDIRVSINSDFDMVNQFEDLSLGQFYR